MAGWAQVDATEEKNKPLASKFDVSGFPTLKIFKDGELYSDYNGPREWKDIAAHMRVRLSPPPLHS
jgi:protein disulfide-isomerase A1